MNPKTVRGGYSYQGLPVPDADMQARAAEKTVLVFGGTKGLGRSIAEAMDKFGVKKVVVFGRTYDAPLPGSKIQFIPVDLSLMQTSQKLADEQEALLAQADEIIFTNGIMTTSRKEETAEKLEKDMAVSYLSRLVILNKIIGLVNAGRARPTLRCWVWGFPGVSKESDKNLLEDLNADKKYEQWPQHMKTVIGNECMVHYYKDTVRIFGLNPGLIKTGIRQPVLGRGFLFSLVEFFIGTCNISAESYGTKVARMILSQDLEAKTCSGMLLNQNLQEVERGALCTEDNVKNFIVESFNMVNRAMLEVLAQPPPSVPVSPTHMK